MMQKEIRLHKKILRKKILRRIAAVMIMQGIIWSIIFWGEADSTRKSCYTE